MAEREHSTSRVARIGVVALAALAAVGLVPAAAQAADPSADLSATLDHAPGVPVANEQVAITLHVRNDGPDVAVGAVAAFAEFYYRFNVVDAPDTCSVSGETGSLICPLGDLAANTTTDLIITVTPQASGLYPVTAAVASSTPDPDSADRTTTDSVIVQKGVSQAERYLTAVFPIVLDRPVDPASLAFWGPRWQQTYRVYPENHESVPAGLLRSAEHRRIVVREGFSRILGRTVDPAGLTYWVAKLGTGFTTEQFERTLLISPEFVREHAGTAYLPAVVEAVLGAAPSGSELTVWKQRTSGLADRRAIATKVQRSTEAYDVLIAAAYDDVFGEAPTALERWSWQVGLRNGETRETMVSDLLVSWKFLANFPLSADDYPYYEEFSVPPADPAALLAEAEAAA